MDTGNGVFEMLQVNQERQRKTVSDLEVINEAKKRNPNHGGTFYVGQNLEVNESKFRVIAISKKTITLRLLPK